VITGERGAALRRAEERVAEHASHFAAECDRLKDTLLEVERLLETGDTEAASGKLTEACDIEADLTGDTLATSDLFDALGLEDGAVLKLLLLEESVR